MKEIYRSQLKAQFDSAVETRCPEYRPFNLRLSKPERREATLFAGSRIYRRVVKDDLHLFLHLIPHRTQELFLLEVGWSTLGRFPHHLTSVGAPEPDGSEMTRPEWLVPFDGLYYRRFDRARLGWDVWRCSVGFDHPKFKEIFVKEDLLPVSEDQARQRVHAAVLECMADITDVAIPYLEKRVAMALSSAG